MSTRPSKCRSLSNKPTRDQIAAPELTGPTELIDKCGVYGTADVRRYGALVIA
jgi:hypothetical protein